MLMYVFFEFIKRRHLQELQEWWGLMTTETGMQITRCSTLTLLLDVLRLFLITTDQIGQNK